MNVIARAVIAILICFAAVGCTRAIASPADDAAIAQIEQHVAETPPAAAASIQSLADYLTRPATTEMQKVRAVYTWIIHNIVYDVAALQAGNPGDQTALTTLNRRKGVCDGYSQLFEALCRAAGLEAMRVIGYTRDSHSPGPLGADPDHAWSAVKADGNWYLLDSTWAAGYIDAKAGFVPRPDDYYFLTPPGQFIYDHLPRDPKWQLIPNPITKDDYINLAYLRPGFFRYGLQVVSTPLAEIASDGNLLIAFGGPETALLRARISDAQAKEDAASIFVQRDGNQLKLNSSFTRTGLYNLRLYAKQRGMDGPYEWAADYRIRVDQLAGQPVIYPETAATFHESNARLYAPMNGKLKSGAAEAFKLSVPGAEAVSVIVDGEWLNLQKTAEAWEGQATIKGDQIQIAARFAGSQSFYILLTYTVS